MAADATPSGAVTSVIGAVAEPSMTGGLTRPQVLHELFQWLERENLLWASRMASMAKVFPDAVAELKKAVVAHCSGVA